MLSSATSTGLVTDRSFPKWLESIMPRDIHRKYVDVRGDETSYKFSRTFSSEVSPASIHQGRADRVNSLPDRQQDSTVLSAENGETGSSVLIRISKENWNISMSKGITITTKYLLSALNQTVEWQSR